MNKGNNYRTMYVVNEKTQPYNETEPTPVERGGGWGIEDTW
jgi:hypothetical protein